MLVKRRPTQAEAERMLLEAARREFHIYERRRLLGLCVACEQPSGGKAHCQDCLDDLRRARAVAA
jgi:hypothetical protein